MPECFYSDRPWNLVISALDPQQFSASLLSVMRDRFDLKPPISEPVEHLFDNPGKMLRPELAYAVAEACGRQVAHKQLFAISAAAELLHNAALVHDDFVDDASTRRNVASLPEKYGPKIAILVGDYLIGVAHHLLAQDASDGSLRKLGPTVQLLAEAELLELQMRHQQLPLEQARRIMIGKAGALFSWVASATAIECREWAGENAWHSWGLNLGMLYQLTDDLSDHLGIGDGKDVGRDVATGTSTMVTVLLSQPDGLNTIQSEISQLCASARRPPALGNRLASFIELVATQTEERLEVLIKQTKAI